MVASTEAVSRLPDGGRFVALDSLRGLAALMVAAFHFRHGGPVFEAMLVRNGWLFVDFFFVLSGFVIAGAYGERLRQGFAPARFMALRLGRLYPLHAAVLLAWILFAGVQSYAVARGWALESPWQEPHAIRSLVLTAALSQWWVNPTPLTWSAQSWSIAVEVWLYLGICLTWRWAGRLSWIIVLGFVGASIAASWSGGGAFNLDMLRGISGFGLGVLAWEAWNRYLAAGAERVGVVPATLLELAAVAAITFMLGRHEVTGVPLWLAPLFVVAVLLFAAERGLVSRLLRLGPFVWLGVLSYSIYMVHGLVLILGQHLLMRFAGVASWQTDIGGLALLLACVGTAYFTWRFIEWPARRWSRRRAEAIGVGPEEARSLTM